MSASNSSKPLPSAVPPKGGDAPPQSRVEKLAAPPPIPKDRYELRVLQSLRRIIRNIEIHSRRLVQEHQVTGPQLACLLALHESGPQTVTALAKLVYLSPATVVGIVDRLVEKGLAVRNRSSDDRRQVLVALTETGEKLGDTSPNLLQNTLAERFRELPELEQVSITLALEKVVDMMEARTIDAAPILTVGSIPAPPDGEKGSGA